MRILVSDGVPESSQVPRAFSSEAQRDALPWLQLLLLQVCELTGVMTKVICLDGVCVSKGSEHVLWSALVSGCAPIDADPESVSPQT
jgi:hypothetical protein